MWAEMGCMRKMSRKQKIALLKMAVLGFYRATQEINDIVFTIGGESDLVNLFSVAGKKLESSVEFTPIVSNVIFIEEWKKRNEFFD